MKRLGIITARHYKATIDSDLFCLSMMKNYAFSTYNVNGYKDLINS